MPSAPQVRSNLTKLGPVHLRVSDADKTAQLWTKVVGLQMTARVEGRIDLGLDAHTLIVLHSSARAPAHGRTTGLFHVALELQSRLDLARAAERLLEMRYRCSGQDYLVNESVFVLPSTGALSSCQSQRLCGRAS